MKPLPYFRWYPADAETDTDYSAMTDAELGFYHRCLNRSWINDGLPSDLDELARAMKVPRSYLDRIWDRVGKRFYEEDGKLRNKRQEAERAVATSKSERATDAVRTRYERRTNEVPRAQARAEFVSVSESDSSSASEEIKKTTLREISKTREIAVISSPPGFDFAAWMEERDRKHPIPGKPQLAIQYAQERIFKQFQPAEFDAAHDAWCEYWKGQEGGIPTLAVFIHEAWWRKRPPIREPPKKKGFVEEVGQLFKERIEKEGKPW